MWVALFVVDVVECQRLRSMEQPKLAATMVNVVVLYFRVPFLCCKDLEL